MSSTKSKLVLSEPWDVIVIGAGAAGLMTCLELPLNLKVLLLNRNTSRRSASRWAQGGIAAVTRAEDSINSHAEDTLKAGHGLCDTDAVNLLVEQAPNCVKSLQRLGMAFDRDGDELATTLEAAHSHRRVLHVQDRTGRALIDVLRDRVEERKNFLHKRGVRVTQLWVTDNQCCGVQVLDGSLLHWIPARAVVLATGGGGHLFANTTNPAQASGEGVSLAWRAGASVEDLEFIQFHPTALKLKNAPCFLISEAVRGEGAELVDSFGESPVRNLKEGNLATRDQVSRALVETMHSQGVSHVGLSLKNIPTTLAEKRFPTILERCRQFGLDPIKYSIPVAPAAHYWMGGVATNLQAATSLNGLYAVGEVACTGLHGANRLASNSLMECLVFAKQLASIELNQINKFSTKQSSAKYERCAQKLTYFTRDQLIIAIESLRELCWEIAGVSRSEKAMDKALSLIKSEMALINQEPLLNIVNNQEKESFTTFEEESRRDINLLLDLNNRQQTSILIIEACLFRTESRGGHFRLDWPTSLRHWECHSQQKINKGISTRPTR